METTSDPKVTALLVRRDLLRDAIWGCKNQICRIQNAKALFASGNVNLTVKVLNNQFREMYAYAVLPQESLVYDLVVNGIDENLAAEQRKYLSFSEELKTIADTLLIYGVPE